MNYNRKKIQRLKHGLILCTYESITEAERDGFNRDLIARVLNGRYKQYKGYEWKYVEQPVLKKNKIIKKPELLKKNNPKEYRTWQGIKKRCFNKSDNGYYNYGGRGITVCERWLTFKFFLLDMGNAPSPDHSIDRIDVNGNYEPGNCRWATKKQQANNMRCNIILEHNGEKKTLPEWAELFKIKSSSLDARLRAGWDAGSALTIPFKKPNKVARDEEINNYYLAGLTITEIATITGIKYPTVAWKIQKLRSGKL